MRGSFGRWTIGMLGVCVLLAASYLLTTRPAAAATTAAANANANATADVNLATVSCTKYENDILAALDPSTSADPIDTVMWLFGFSVASTGERVMYGGDSLSAFGFALDAQCKDNPGMALLQAVVAVRSKRDNPMDLTRLDCATFETRHHAVRTSDPESATTLTMWLFGYAVGLSGGHILDASAVDRFDAALDDHCSKHPTDTLYDALAGPNVAVPHQSTSPPQRSR